MLASSYARRLPTLDHPVEFACTRFALHASPASLPSAFLQCPGELLRTRQRLWLWFRLCCIRHSEVAHAAESYAWRRGEHRRGRRHSLTTTARTHGRRHNFHTIDSHIIQVRRFVTVIRGKLRTGHDEHVIALALAPINQDFDSLVPPDSRIHACTRGAFAVCTTTVPFALPLIHILPAVCVLRDERHPLSKNTRSPSSEIH